MKLIFAQGNPGSKYATTRHNVGFMVIDAFAKEQGGSWKAESKFNAELCKLTIKSEVVLLVKPLSFYNDTGLVARMLVDFYKLTPKDDVLVIHDELALPFGTLRMREKGSDAGNNGIKSINSHLGQDYWRIRIGVWNERRDQIDDAAFVLSAFSAEEMTRLSETILPSTITMIESFVQKSPQATSLKHEN